MEENKKFLIENKKIWVAGSNGMVGKSIIKLLKQRKCKLIFSDRKDLDLTDQRMVKNWMYQNKPEVIFLAASAPIPAEDPVITATLSSKFIFSLSVF